MVATQGRADALRQPSTRRMLDAGNRALIKPNLVADTGMDSDALRTAAGEHAVQSTLGSTLFRPARRIPIPAWPGAGDSNCIDAGNVPARAIRRPGASTELRTRFANPGGRHVSPTQPGILTENTKKEKERSCQNHF